MKAKSLICILMILAMLFSFAACGGVAPESTPGEAPTVPETTPEAIAPAVTPEPTQAPDAVPSAEPAPQADPKMQAIFTALPSLQQGGTGDWRYAVTDLDHNGMPELLAASQHRADRSTTLKAWELGENMEALYECSVALEEGESFPDILSDNADTFHNTASDTWSYLFYDDILLSENEGYTAKCGVTMKDRTVRYETYAIEHVTVSGGNRTVEYMDMNGAQLAPEGFNAAGLTAFAGAEMSSSNFGWFRYEDAVDAAVLENSYAVFTGEQTPDKTNPLPQPQPLGQVDPNPSPVPGTAPLFLYVTKNPTNERRVEGETAYFVAFANVYTSLSWTFVSPEGGEYSPQSFANKFPGVQLYGLYSTTLSIAKLPKQADRWGAYCTFNYEGQTARTNTAYITVLANPNPSPTPAPTTVPTVTPAPTAAPTATPEPTVEPTVAPTATPEPTAAPAPTTEPAPVPPEGDVIGRGGFSSETGTGLDLCCDWVATKVSDTQAEVTVNLSIRSATIHLNYLANGLHIELNGTIVELPQPALDYQGGKTTTFLGGRNIPVTLGEGVTELPLMAVWYYKGSYGGQSLPEISCVGTIRLENQPEPQPAPEPVYASMAGVIIGIEESEYRIELANGQIVTVDPSICRLAYGTLNVGCSCTVYYENEPSTETIYLVDIYGDVQPAPEPEPTEEPQPTGEPEPTEEPQPEPTEEPQPEPETLDVIGSYAEKNNDSFTIKVEKSDDAAKGEYKITITRKGDSGSTKWVLYGSFNAEGKLSYSNCQKTSDIEGEATYSDGKGSLSFDKAGKHLTWKDEKENAGKDLVFKKK